MMRILRHAEITEYTSKKGVAYSILNDNGELVVSKVKTVNGYTALGNTVKPTREILDQFLPEKELKGDEKRMIKILQQRYLILLGFDLEGQDSAMRELMHRYFGQKDMVEMITGKSVIIDDYNNVGLFERSLDHEGFFF